MEEEEVKAHKNEGDCWVILQGKVYNISEYMHQHPGGKEILKKYGGKDATLPFLRAGHRSPSVSSTLSELYIGDVKRKNNLLLPLPRGPL